MLTYPFTEAAMAKAHEDWGCNCGPSALAFALQKPLEYVRDAIPDFDAKRFTSPTMMRAALDGLGVSYGVVRSNDKNAMFSGNYPSLVRIQWCGPWTQPGANPKWAYRQTHWICTYMVEGQAAMVFDCNGGIRGFHSWMNDVVPALTEVIPRANGEWFPANIWQITA